MKAKNIDNLKRITLLEIVLNLLKAENWEIVAYLNKSNKNKKKNQKEVHCYNNLMRTESNFNLTRAENREKVDYLSVLIKWKLEGIARKTKRKYISITIIRVQKAINQKK